MSDRDEEPTTFCDSEECGVEAKFKDQYGHNYCNMCKMYHGHIEPKLIFEYLQGRG